MYGEVRERGEHRREREGGGDSLIHMVTLETSHREVSVELIRIETLRMERGEV